MRVGTLSVHTSQFISSSGRRWCGDGTSIGSRPRYFPSVTEDLASSSSVPKVDHPGWSKVIGAALQWVQRDCLVRHPCPNSSRGVNHPPPDHVFPSTESSVSSRRGSHLSSLKCDVARHPRQSLELCVELSTHSTLSSSRNQVTRHELCSVILEVTLAIPPRRRCCTVTEEWIALELGAIYCGYRAFRGLGVGLSIVG